MTGLSRGILFVVVAPSGAGKSTLIKRLKVDCPELKWSVSTTTRPMRTGEQHGVDYFFVTKDEFERRRDAGGFVEWAQVHANYYGTSRQFVEEGLARGERLLFDVDVQGADALKRAFGHDVVAVFIAPPSILELERRLRGRGTDSDEVIQRRVQNAASEMRRQHDYDYCVINDDLERAYADLKRIYMEAQPR